MIALVPSRSRAGRQHAVVVEADRVLCTCEAFQHRQQCFHLEAVLSDVAQCQSCGGTVSRQPGVVACNRCEWAAVNEESSCRPS